MIDPFVDPQWLLAELDDVVVLHVGTTMGGADPASGYVRRHIDGARHVVLETALSDTAGPVIGRHPLASAERFAEEMAVAGVGDEATVVVYDDGMGALAARLVWMLRIIGQNAALLDGGLVLWNGPTATGPGIRVSRASRRVVEWPAESLADADDVAEHIAAGGTVIDSRSAQRYRGESEPIDAVAGHIRGAINLDIADNVDAHGTLVDGAALTSRFSIIGDDASPIVYCGSGVTACHNALAIEVTSRLLPRVYVGSWSGWSTDPARSIASA